MKLKNRIIISFFIVILAPIVLGFLFFGVMMHARVEALGEKYGIENPTYESLMNNMLMLGKMTEGDVEKVREAAKEDPEKLMERTFQADINKRMSEAFSFLVIRKGDEIVYNGSIGEGAALRIDSKTLLADLPEYGELKDADKGIYTYNSGEAMIRQVDFTLSDQTKCSAFIFTHSTRVLPQIKLLIIEGLVFIVVILILTSLLMSIWIYQGIVTPLFHLKKATQNIKEGNLDFTVERSGAKEIRDLCEDFEEMRVRLKESAQEKVAYDSDNKELISNISHDLKTPITAVKGYVEGIMDGVADTPEKMDKYIRTIYNKANEMDRLINELTFYSKIDTNRIPYTFTKIHVAEYFKDCVDEIGLELDSKHIDLGYFNYLDEDLVVIADAEQIKRVINNIISNSVKYMDKARKMINIRLRDAGDFIQVEIEDNGRGIDQKDVAKIFDRFYRTDTSRNSTRGGSGIGLSIVRKIIEDHGGKVWATSKEGVGTVMCFVLRKYQEVPAGE